MSLRAKNFARRAHPSSKGQNEDLDFLGDAKIHQDRSLDKSSPSIREAPHRNNPLQTVKHQSDKEKLFPVLKKMQDTTLRSTSNFNNSNIGNVTP